MKYLNNYTNFRLNENSSFLKDPKEILEKLTLLCDNFNPGLATIHPDGTVDYAGSIRFIRRRGLSKLPVKFGQVNGFSCAGLGLTTLEGCPEKVEGFFFADQNELTDLKGFPKFVGSHIKLSFNKLTTLEGLNYHKGNLFLDNNKLTSWNGGPDQIYPDGDPSALNVMKNLFTDLKGFPTQLNGYFQVENNPHLTSLEGFPQVCLELPGVLFGDRIPGSKFSVRILGMPNLFFMERYDGDFDLDFGELPQTSHEEEFSFRFVAQSTSEFAPPPISQIVQLFPSHKDFMDSLDYRYFKMVDGKPGIIEWRFRQALEELDLPFPLNPPYWHNNSKYRGCQDLGIYIYVDDTGKRVEGLQGVPPWNYYTAAGRAIATGYMDPNIYTQDDGREYNGYAVSGRS